MGKNIYFGVGDKARNIKNAYIGIGGKARKIKNAYVGVAGKAHQFWSSGANVTVSGNGDSSYCYVQYNGTPYLSGSFSVSAGEIISFVLYTESVSNSAKVRVNGSEVFREISTGLHTFNWTVPSEATDISIVLSYYGRSYMKGRGEADITY